ncbi:MAG: hypothetical protein ABSA17_01435 [Rhabdochlamydiaceae bacterium]|jgi:hypothetical protein
MHKVSSSNLWAYKAVGALAGAAVSPGGLLPRAGFALAGSWAYSKLAQRVHPNQRVNFSYATAITASVALTRLFYKAAPTGKEVHAVFAGLMVSALACKVLLPWHKTAEEKTFEQELEDLDQNYTSQRFYSLLEHAGHDDKKLMLFVKKFPVEGVYDEMRLNYENPADVPWSTSTLHYILKSMPAEKVLPWLRILQQWKSPCLLEALNDVFSGETQWHPPVDFVCEFIGTIFNRSDALFNRITEGLRPVILHHTAHDPKKQIRLLQQHPLNGSYIRRVEGGFLYPQLADGTMDHLMEQDGRSVWDIAFCARQRTSARMALSSLRDDELLPLDNIPCRSYSRHCMDHSLCWESSLIKLAVESLTGDRAEAFLQLMSTNNSVWFKFALRHVLRGPTRLSDDQLITWAGSDWEVAQVIVDARPHLYAHCLEPIQSKLDLFMTPAMYSAVVAAGFKPRHVDVKTIIDTISYVYNASVAKLEEAKIDREKTLSLVVQELKSLTEHNRLPIYLYADDSLITYLTKQHGFDFSSFSQYKALYDIWHSTETHCLPLNFFFHENNYQHVLPWLAKALTGTAAVEVTPIVQAEINARPTPYARIARLWGFGKEGASERLVKLLETLQLDDPAKCRFKQEALEGSLFYSYHDHWEPEWGRLRSQSPEAAIIHLASLFRSKGTFYNLLEVAGCIETLNNVPEETERKKTFPMGVVHNICRFLSIQQRLRFASTCKGMLRYICRQEGEPIWRALGSLRAVRDMYRLYRLELNNGEAQILRKAILRNLPHLIGMKHA